jgi:hypothetical protein
MTAGEDHASFATGPADGLADLHDPMPLGRKRSVAGRLAVRALASQIGPWAWASRGIWSMLSR